jgi:hypothetical protein
MRAAGDEDGLATELTAKSDKNYEMSNSNQTDTQSSPSDVLLLQILGWILILMRVRR